MSLVTLWFQMNSATIAVDCDDVLGETRDAMLAYHNYTFMGKPIRREYIRSFTFWELEAYKADIKDGVEYFREFFCSDANHTVQPIQGAFEKLTALREQGYRLVVVTGRSEKITKEYTTERIEKHYPSLFSDVVFANHYGDFHMKKSVLCERIGATTIIEDCLENALDTAQVGIKSIVLAKPRNEHYDPVLHHNVQRVAGRHELNF